MSWGTWGFPRPAGPLPRGVRSSRGGATFNFLRTVRPAVHGGPPASVPTKAPGGPVPASPPAPVTPYLSVTSSELLIRNMRLDLTAELAGRAGLQCSLTRTEARTKGKHVSERCSLPGGDLARRPASQITTCTLYVTCQLFVHYTPQNKFFFKKGSPTFYPGGDL